MRTTYLALGVGAFLALAILVDYLKPDTTPPLPPAGPIPLACDRECLEGVVDEYLAALVSHDPSTLPLSGDLRVSENNQMLEIGDGFWKTVTRRGGYGHYFADPEMGQAAFIGTMVEGSSQVLMALRIRIELGRITEVETFASRLAGNGLSLLDTLAEPSSAWLEAIPQSERPGRPEIVAVANGYFEELQAGAREGARLFTPECYALENGATLSCGEQFELASFGSLTSVHQRRFPLVDAERGVVWAYSVRDHDGTRPDRNGAAEGELTGASQAPRSFHAIEAFLIEGGLIQGIEVALFAAPYHSNSPWDGGLSGR